MHPLYNLYCMCKYTNTYYTYIIITKSNRFYSFYPFTGIWNTHNKLSTNNVLNVGGV